MLEVKHLGVFQATDCHGRVLGFSTAKTKALFGYLAFHAGQSFSRESLAGLLWPDAPRDRARANVRQALSRIRTALPESLYHCVVADSSSLKLDANSLQTDVDEFLGLAGQADLKSREKAVSLYRGDFLHDLLIDESPFAEWVNHERLRLREKAIECFDYLLEIYRNTGSLTRGIPIANRLLEIEPHRESVHRLLMTFYATQERRGAALDQFQRCADILETEYGVEPEDETRALYDSIRQNSLTTIFSECPELSRLGTGLSVQTRPDSRAAIELIKRSPWRSVDWTIPSIAILPLECLNRDEDYQHLAVGIVEELVTCLSRFRELHVISRGSSMCVANSPLDIVEQGDLIGARYLMQGSMQKQGDRIRVTVNLIEVESGRYLWSESYDEKLDGLLNIRDSLANRIVGQLVGNIEQQNLAKLSSRLPDDWAAYEFWLKGMNALRQFNSQAIKQAENYFLGALEKDPNYARAYTGLAMMQIKSWCYLDWMAWWHLEDKALQYVNKAIELEQNDHHAHCMLGIISGFTRDYTKSRFHLERAEQINPHDARTLANASISWMLLGEAEKAIHMSELAIRLDPYHPDWYLTSLGSAYYSAQDYERSVAALEIAPNGLCDTPAYYAAALARCGRIEEARFQGRQLIQLCCERMGGDPETDADRHVKSIVDSNTFLKSEDADHFIEGLRIAGLPVD